MSMIALDALAKVFAGFGHPTRLRIAVLLSEANMSPVQATARIEGSKLGTVAHHFRSLHAAGLIRQTSTRPRRGAVEHFYALTDDGKDLLNTLGLSPNAAVQDRPGRPED